MLSDQITMLDWRNPSTRPPDATVIFLSRAPIPEIIFCNGIRYLGICIRSELLLDRIPPIGDVGCMVYLL